MPFYLATREFFELVREHLAPGGIVALNVATIPGDEGSSEGLAGTLATEFPIVQVVARASLQPHRASASATTPVQERNLPDASSPVRSSS